MSELYYESFLAHHGIKGMRWGIRRFQDKNGTLTRAGEKRYAVASKKSVFKNIDDRLLRNKKEQDIEEQDIKSEKEYDAKKRENMKRVALGLAVTAGVGAAMYFAYKHDAVTRIRDAIKSSNNTADLKNIAADAMNKAKDDSDIVFKKGQIFHRMTAAPNIDFSKVNDATYVAYKKKDIETYMTQLKDWSGTGKRYDVTLEAIKEIRAPSAEKAKTVFNELWKNDSKYRDDLEHTIVQTYKELLQKQNPGAPATLVLQRAVQQAHSDILKDPFKMGMYSIVRRQEDSKRLIKTFVDRGYSAIEDYFDKGSMSDNPMILFNPSSSVVKTGEKFVTERMKVLAQMGLWHQYL